MILVCIILAACNNHLKSLLLSVGVCRYEARGGASVLA